MSTKVKIFSTFSGIGGFEKGIIDAIGERAEFIGFSEIDSYATQIYKKHFNHKNYGDITKIEAAELPDFDLLVGGFPCQSFSIAGKRRGFDDTRGTLFFEIARIIREKQPRLLLLENVKGLLSHDKGNTFFTIISTLDELGYDCQWQVLNSKNFGVPQNRERVFIVGNLRGTPRPEVFPIGEDVQPLITKGGRQASNAVVSRTLTATDAKMHLDGNYIKQLNKPKHSNDRVYGADGLSPTLNTMQGGNRQPFIQSRPHGFNKGGEREFPNVRSSTPHNEIVNGIRRLTPLECERLQGFPDEWTKYGNMIIKNQNVGFSTSPMKFNEISDSQRYKCCGNAVTVNVIREITKRLLN